MPVVSPLAPVPVCHNVWNNEPAAELRFVAAIDAGISAMYVFPLRPDHGSSFYSPADDLRVGAV